jgi:hypothetical protein
MKVRFLWPRVSVLGGEGGVGRICGILFGCLGFYSRRSRRWPCYGLSIDEMWMALASLSATQFLEYALMLCSCCGFVLWVTVGMSFR